MNRQYQFPNYMQRVFEQALEWLDGMEDTAGYRFGNVNLDYTEIHEVGTHFNRYFPTHYFKVVSAFQEIISYDLVRTWVQNNGCICLVDVGCGSGAATCAFVEVVSSVFAKLDTNTPLRLHVIGVDPTRAAIVTYRGVLDRINKSGALPFGLTITHEFLPGKLPDHTNKLLRMLINRRTIWDQPSIPHTILLQVNTVRNFHEQGAIHDVAKAHAQVFADTSLDHIHILTIATEGFEQQVKEMNRHLQSQFSSHQSLKNTFQSISYRYRNPDKSYFRKQGYPEYRSCYHAAFSSIKNASWQMDGTWQRIIRRENIKRAWARARTALLRESLIDEAEIRLRDHNVDRFIDQLQARLIAYAEDIFHPKDQIYYDFPKNAESFRPKSLTRFEEEILSVAIIQVAGDEYGTHRNLYAYRLNQTDHHESEYLYSYYGNAYKEWMFDAFEVAQSTPDGVVLETDLASFYTCISQERLADTLLLEMRAESSRVTWLLNKILGKHLDDHRKNFGLAQGGVGSGYYANVYLAPVDDYFISTNSLGVDYFRYADDMLIVVPNDVAVDDVIRELDNQLESLGLKRNESKTTNTSTGLFQATKFSPALEQLGLKLNRALKELWLAACDYHGQLDIGSGTFYEFLHEYQRRLRSIGITVSVPMLRRKVRKYQALSTGNANIALPDFGDQLGDVQWARQFQAMNPIWMEDITSLREQFEFNVITILESAKGNYKLIDRNTGSALRFCTSRLCRLGLSARSAQLLEDLLMVAPYQLRATSFLLESLSTQGHIRIIENLYEFYTEQSDRDETYLRAMLLRAMRYFEDTPLDLLFSVVVDSQESIEARLMASESLLAANVSEIGYEHWANLNNTLSNESLIPRLRKNLILILRQVRDRDPQTFAPQQGDDPMLFDAFDIDEGLNIFEQAEPPILMNYYDLTDPDDAYDYGELMTTISH